jgi:hypothetical protein
MVTKGAGVPLAALDGSSCGPHPTANNINKKNPNNLLVLIKVFSAHSAFSAVKSFYNALLRALRVLCGEKFL